MNMESKLEHSQVNHYKSTSFDLVSASSELIYVHLSRDPSHRELRY